jgi:glycerol kinase/glycerophosphoryl diester phosphodiesterase
VIADRRRFVVVGHRGAAARAPENTASSLIAGLRAGADAIEIDVGLTRDGRVVLLHDTTLDRTTNARGPLRGLSWNKVHALDAGSWFSKRFAGEPPIDLDDALAIVRAHVPLIVEVKAIAREQARGVSSADRELVDGVLAAFARTGGLRGVTVSSSAWTLLDYAKTRAHGLDLALTVRSLERRDPIAWAQALGATALHPSRRLCNPAFVAGARGLGLAVIAYTVNRTAELAPLLAAGVDGVFTDDPAGMRRKLTPPDDTAEPRAMTLGIDQGSGGTRAVLVDVHGKIVDASEARLGFTRTRTGAIVQDAEAVAASVVRAAGPMCVTGKPFAAGLAVQRSSLVVWRRSDGKPVTPVLSWRAGENYTPTPELAARGREIARATGLTVRFPYGAIRLAALCREQPEIARGLDEGKLVAGPLGAFLAARLIRGEDADCDPSLAQRTLAFDIGTAAWSDTLAQALGVKTSWWPAVRPSTAHRGPLRLGRARVPLRALSGDVGAAVRAVADDAGDPRDGVLVLGTGGFVVAPTGRFARVAEGLLTTLLYEDTAGPMYALEGTVHGVAAAIVEAGRRGGWDALAVERIAARSAHAKRNPRVTAAPEGTGTPDWEVTPRFEVEPGQFEADEIVRGTLDDLAGRFATIAKLLRDAGSGRDRFIALGGLASAPHFTTRIAAAMSAELTIDKRPHRTAVGAALLARDAGR